MPDKRVTNDNDSFIVVTASDAARKLRTKAYLDTLAEKDMTISELARATKQPYSTTHREINRLVTTFQVHPTGAMRNKAPVYRNGNANTSEPDLFMPSTQQSATILTLIQNHIDAGFNQPTLAAKAAQSFTTMLVRYLTMCASVGKGSTRFTRDDIQALRNDFVDARNKLMNTVSMMEQMIENDKRWTQTEMRRIGQLPKHTSDDIDTITKTANTQLFPTIKEEPTEPATEPLEDLL